MRRIYLLVLILMFVPRIAWGAEVSANIDRQELSMGETLSLTINIQDGDGDIDLAPLETSEDFRVVGRSTSTRLNIVNFKASRTSSYFIGLAPLKTGELTIPPLAVDVDGQTFNTPKFVVNVTDGAPNNGSGTNNRLYRTPRGGAAASGSTVQPPDPQAAAGGDGIMLLPEISHPQPYAHEQFLYTLKVYVGEGIRDPRLQDPDFNGFSVKKLEKPKQYRSQMNNREYAVTEFSYLLTPEQAGTFTIGPATLHYEVPQQIRNRRRSPFDSFFDDNFFGGLQTVPRTTNSRPVTVDVRQLPAYSGKQPFSGLVGSFLLKATLDKNSITMGDSAMLTLELEGLGNIRDAGEPPVDIPKDLKIYKEKPEESVTANPSGVVGKKIFRQALVPLQPGTYAIPETQLVYFDTKKNAYETLHTSPLQLSVSPAAHAETPVIATPAPVQTLPHADKQQVEYLDKDILPLKEGIEALDDNRPFTPELALLLLALPPVLVLLLLLGKRYLRPQENRCKLLQRRAEAALQEAAQCASQTDAAARSAAPGHCAKALVAAVFARADREGSSLTYEEAREALLSHGVPAERAAAVVALMQKVDAAQYGGSVSSELDSLINDVRTMVKELCA